MPGLPPTTLSVLSTDGAVLLSSVLDDPGSALVQYGVLGALAAFLGPFAYQAYKWQIKRGDRAEAQVLEMQVYIRDKVVPALLESAGANRASAEANRVAAEAARDATVLIRDLARGTGVP